MHAQPSLVGLEPSRAAKFCSASSSPTMLLNYLCVRVAETVKTVQISVLDFIGSTKIS